MFQHATQCLRIIIAERLRIRYLWQLWVVFQKGIIQPDMTSSVDTSAQYSLLSGSARPRAVIIERYETVT